jgi:hypothetical protein
MGGLACLVPWRAIVQYDEVPPKQAKQKEFEAQMRQALAVPSVYDSTVERGVAQQVCDLLAKPSPLSEADLHQLHELAEPPY